MKIEKIQYLNDSQGFNIDSNIISNTTSLVNHKDILPVITLHKLSDNKIYVSDLEGNTHTITLDSKDILKLMTWLVGQEKHKAEISSSKPVWGPELQSQNYSKTDKENQKIGENLIRALERLLGLKKIGEKSLKSNIQEKREMSQMVIDGYNLEIDCLEQIKEA